MIYRQGTVADIQHIETFVWQAIFPAYEHPDLKDAQRAENDEIVETARAQCMEAMQHPEKRLWVAHDEKRRELAAFAIVYQPSEAEAHLQQFIVARRHWAKGVSDTLLRLLLEALPVGLFLFTGVHYYNQRAIRFLKRHGFSPTDSLSSTTLIPQLWWQKRIEAFASSVRASQEESKQSLFPEEKIGAAAWEVEKQEQEPLIDPLLEEEVPIAAWKAELAALLETEFDEDEALYRAHPAEAVKVAVQEVKVTEAASSTLPFVFENPTKASSSLWPRPKAHRMDTSKRITPIRFEFAWEESLANQVEASPEEEIELSSAAVDDLRCEVAATDEWDEPALYQLTLDELADNSGDQLEDLGTISAPILAEEPLAEDELAYEQDEALDEALDEIQDYELEEVLYLEDIVLEDIVLEDEPEEPAFVLDDTKGRAREVEWDLSKPNQKKANKDEAGSAMLLDLPRPKELGIRFREILFDFSNRLFGKRVARDLVELSEEPDFQLVLESAFASLRSWLARHLPSSADPQSELERRIVYSCSELAEYVIVALGKKVHQQVFAEEVLRYQACEWKQTDLFGMVNTYLQLEQEYEVVYRDFITMPTRKLRNATKHFLLARPNEVIYFIVDQSFLGTASNGFACTNRCIYWKNPLQPNHAVYFSDLESIKIKGGSLWINGHFFDAGFSINLKLALLLEKIKRMQLIHAAAA